MTLRFAFDSIGTNGPLHNLTQTASLAIASSFFLNMIDAHNLRPQVEIALLSNLRSDALYLYPIGTAAIPSNWKERWLADTAEAHDFGDKLRYLATISNLYLLLDNTGESIDTEQLKILVETLSLIGYPPHKTVLLTSNIFTPRLSEIPYRFGLLPHGAYYLESITYLYSVKDIAAIQSIDPKRNVDKLFLSLNRRPKWYRILLSAIAERSGWGDDTFLSFGGVSLEADFLDWHTQIPKAVEAIAALTSANISEEDVLEFVKKGAINLDQDFGSSHTTGSMAYHSNDSIFPFFARSFMSIITETYYTSDIFDTSLTEKTFKPIALGHPFILLSTPGSLGELRSLGYETFSPFIDETYDTITDPVQRFDATISSVSSIYQLLRNRDPLIMSALREIAAHNQQNFFQNTPARFRNALSDLELAFMRMRLSRAEIGAKAAIGDETTGRTLLLSTSELVSLGGFYGLETASGGRWCGSMGQIYITLPRGRWLVELRFGSGVSQNSPVFVVNTARVDPSWAIIDKDCASVEIFSPGGLNVIELHSRSIFIPAEHGPAGADARMLGFWLFDEFAIRRVKKD
jgi:hypothetical protein